MSSSRPRRSGFEVHITRADGSPGFRISSTALSIAAFLLLAGLAGLSLFGAYHYIRAQRLAARFEVQTPDTRTRELQRAILDQQGRVQSLQDDYLNLTAQVEAQHERFQREIDRLAAQMRELDRLANELRGLLGLPQPAPPPAPTPRSQSQPVGAPVRVVGPSGGREVIGPQAVVFPAIDLDPHNTTLRLSVLQTQVVAHEAALRSMQAEVAARRAQAAAAERARVEAEAARQAAEVAERARAEAEAQAASQAAAQAAAKKTVSLDPQLAQLDSQIAGLIQRLRDSVNGTAQPKQILSIPLPKNGAGAPKTWPLRGDVSSSYGPRIFREKNDWHTGVDIAVDMNTEIHSTQSGIVVFAGWQTGYGWCIEVGHGQGYSTFYAHLARILVDVGDGVEVGRLIGLAGSSGNSTGPHLHYEVRLNGKAIDPKPYLP